MSKKTVLIHSNFLRAFTGFGKNKKNIMRYLFDTGKYNLVEDLTKYNIYKKNGDRLSLELEEIILNKVLLIKAIRDKKYKQAEEFSTKLNL